MITVDKLLSLSNPHPDILFWHSFWHTVWKYIYWIMFGIIWLWHSFWHILWHSFWHSIVAFSLTWALLDLDHEQQISMGWGPAVPEEEEEYDEEEKATLTNGAEKTLWAAEHPQIKNKGCWSCPDTPGSTCESSWPVRHPPSLSRLQFCNAPGLLLPVSGS